MQSVSDVIMNLYEKWKGKPALSLDLLPQSGSDRRYFRIHEAQNGPTGTQGGPTGAQSGPIGAQSGPIGAQGGSVIATVGANTRENEVFIYFSNHFQQKQLPTPRIFAVNDETTIYLQEDFGDASLLNKLESLGLCDEVYGLFKQSLQELARLQVTADEGLDYNQCLTNKEFGKQAIMADLLYFKYYFLDALRKPYDKQKLIDDFEALSSYLTHTEYKYFMFRDFQSRNILVDDAGKVHFIDYQGGMKGAPQYDVASMLWQAKANLPDDWKSRLLVDYIDAFENIIGQPVDRGIFQSQYNGYVLIRLLQVLGAYGFRGLFERKAHFLTSIPMALRNVRDFIVNQNVGIAVPEFRKVLDICVSEEIIERFTPLRADETTPLVVNINSFSYRKGIPQDVSGNGGGYVFDCRGILNPGRIDKYKPFHGKDKEVKDFLEQQTRMPEFLNSVFDVVDITVEDYLRRGFNNLMVSFGCTGGQHRSVYAAEALARHLKNKFGVKIEINHIEQEAKKWVNT